MKRICADTNILVRSIVRDDKAQAAVAERILSSAEIIALPLTCLCELVWVLARVYDMPREDVADTLRSLLTVRAIAVNRPAAEAGLAVFERGGDFADGVIAYEGYSLGGKTFVSFDKRAVKALKAAGLKAQLAG
ncbi:type II toxin-antitoxin system VapC family toxin [Algiphilus sp. NNCM1]|uniref:type II toxin-antitoxin system VapC family toxin n=1 Tax=Algiphilus sp. TaxID=1872431 RepID=UPI001CA6320A|nr:type II toxin-antitoxin system VapC family toxin [Algiphilus sp.]MBY8965963.1 type II toxin-antitoxin system VapC family toxin [Algiphilus acroporae]MCI5062389.1 type II toxin-antitoxin system VapC family toxin [Algiphilus sp.]MCI5102315.1 type II toxin-antitoxin system VapC family toxin [Algiphilus sp.]